MFCGRGNEYVTVNDTHISNRWQSQGVPADPKAIYNNILKIFYFCSFFVFNQMKSKQTN